MSFGNRRLDEAYDKWVTQTPEEYYGYQEEICQGCEEKTPMDNIPLCRQCFLQWAKEKIKHFGDDKHDKIRRN